MVEIFAKIRILRAFATIVREPTRVDKVLEVSDAIRARYRREGKTLRLPLFDEPDFIEIFEKRYHPPMNLSELRKLPAGTFGRPVVDFLDLNGLDPSALPHIEGSDPVDYLMARVRRTHDLIHVLTEYGTSPEDEMALQSFLIAQMSLPVAAFSIAAGILHFLVYQPTELYRVFGLLNDGYNRGLRARRLLTAPLEEYWKRDLHELRTELGVVPPLNSRVKGASLARG